ncbi:MAG: CRTAC1 family protein [Candidatus Halalkalibacterium sp. M3_1C_030]
MPRRKKKILIASLLMAAAFIVAAWGLWGEEENDRYIPGTKVEGLTSRLDRGIPDNYRPVTFKDVTQTAGIDFQHFNQTRTSQLPEDMGSGAAWIDYNDDGWDDLFILNFSTSMNEEAGSSASSENKSALYKNNGDGTFANISSESGLDISARAIGVAAGDYNNDGLQDLFISTYGENMLFKNTGDESFEDVSGSSGINGIEGFWAGASWSDYDRDGDLDLYVTGYVKYIDFGLTNEDLAAEEPPSINPSSFRPERNLLYKNNGDGTFTEIAEKAGVINESGRSLSASWVDVNNDLWPDLYVANDVSDNVLYINRQDGTFEDFSHSAHVADYRGAMGIATGDWDIDGDMDLFVTHWIAQENALYTNRWIDTLQSRNRGKLQFKDDSAIHGLGQSSLDFVSWATSFVDFDLDSRLDLFVINGSTFQYPENPAELKPMTDQIYWNADNRQGFYDVSAVSGSYFQQEYVGRGAAYSDYDQDGDIDLFILNNNGPGILLRNEQEFENNWLAVHMEASQNSILHGTKIRVVTDGISQVRQIGSQSSYLSQNTLVQHFGIGKYETIDTLEIIRTTGQKTVRLNIRPNQIFNIE